jgi:hypothetical protein
MRRLHDSKLTYIEEKLGNDLNRVYSESVSEKVHVVYVSISSKAQAHMN